jgi:pyruvate/2-oxoglutarate dehydrogenase complex dihydrolipoamide acyltransferase (E2) component
MELDVTTVEEALARLNAQRQEPQQANQGGKGKAAAVAEQGPAVAKVTWTHVFAWATAMALKENPRANARVHLGRVIPCRSVDIFMQVALEGDSLSGVKVDGASELNAAEIADVANRKVTALRGGKDKVFQATLSNLRFIPAFVLGPVLRLTSLLGNDLALNIPWLGVPRDPFGTAQVTSLGMFDVDLAFAPFFPLSNGATLILVPSVKSRPMAIDGQVQVRRTINLCATFDHRVVDGVLAAKFSHSIKTALENFARVHGVSARS